MDPNGNATNGITRTQTNSASFADDDGIKSAASGGADPWPADRYLNIWTAPRVTSPVGDLLGYAQFPGGASATDGVVILHSAFGTNGTATAPFNLGRTATHEVGHWLNLFHIWGDDGSGCTGSNGPNGDLFMNYMDYVDDVAMFMVTAGQVVRMQAALDNERSTIGTTRPVLTSPRVPARAQVGVVSRSTDKLDIFVTDRNGVVFTAAWEPAFTDWWHGWWELNVGRASLDGGVGAGVYRLVAWLVADRRMR